MLEEPAPISAEVSERIQRYYNNNADFAPDCSNCTGGNNRVTKPLGARTLYYNDGAIESAVLSAVALSALATLAL
jgi:hypothetical protein